MRHFNKYILIGLLSFTAIGCVNEEFVPEFEEAEVPMTFIATIEKGVDGFFARVHVATAFDNCNLNATLRKIQRQK